MAMYDAVDEVGRVCAREAIDAHFLKSGALRIARGRHQLPAIEDAYAAYERLGLADHYGLLDREETAVRIQVTSEEQWHAIGWRRRECVSSTRYTVDYLTRTCEGRILLGSRGAPYHYASRIDDRYDRHRPTQQMIERLVVEWFPMLRGVAFTHTWAGPVGMPRDWMPTVSYDREIGVATARGYTGQGVATSNLAGRLLADLITDSDSPLTALPLNGHRSPRWEPEPLRWLAIRAIQAGYARLDSRAERTGRAPTGRTLVERLGRH